MNLMQGDMFEGRFKNMFNLGSLFLVTGNSYITAKKELVMGRGAAEQLKERFPGLPKTFADIIPHLKFYGIVTCSIFYGEVGVFQVKTSWKGPASLDLIEKSTKMLSQIASNYDRVDMNFPGIGNGRLKRESVLPYIVDLPDNIYIWECNDGTNTGTKRRSKK